MAHEVTIGGERLGSGKKMKAYLHEYERSTHDLSYVWRSTMASGTLVPFMSQVALPGDTFDIHLNCEILTHPTIGPLFGSYKVQLDVFQVPMRLYNGKLHMNLLGVGMEMAKVLLPQVKLQGNKLDPTRHLDNQHVNPSCVFSYLGIRGLGYTALNEDMGRKFNAIPWLGMWDIYKNYYANKQEEIGAVIHKDTTATAVTITGATLKDGIPSTDVVIPINSVPPFTYTDFQALDNSTLVITGTGITDNIDASGILLQTRSNYGAEEPEGVIPATDLFEKWEPFIDQQTLIGSKPTAMAKNLRLGYGGISIDTQLVRNTDTQPTVVTFPLSNIDEMRKRLLKWSDDTEFVITTAETLTPYNLPLAFSAISAGVYDFSATYNQEGLPIKTYQSDLFNNWVSTEWIDGPDGISAITAIDTSGGSFTIDELNLSRKIYDMLNRIAISGGSYDDWLDAVYTHERVRSAENPMYLGGLIKNLVFQEVVSNAAVPETQSTFKQPLGSLAGKGRMGDKNVGGNIVAKIDEPSYLIGLISLTPNVDYSQGNSWDMNLRTLNDLHKPQLDQIGFQDLSTDQLAWFDTLLDANENPVFKSAGKQPAWVNYMTNVNKVYGNFADQNQQMYMVLNRRYSARFPGSGSAEISDLTTYIDPTKFNHIFADTRRDAQNFWAQIGVNMTARRKMSAKIMPNL